MKKSRILIELTGRYLTDEEADQVRLMVAALKPKTHLVMSGWRWIEARGLAEQKALQLIASLQALGLRFTVKGQGMSYIGQPRKRATAALLAQI